ncbi:hypothetical protein ACLGIH_19490 [Streptomyces sp. HMX87]
MSHGKTGSAGGPGEPAEGSPLLDDQPCCALYAARLGGDARAATSM